jgi:hypothetical protein
MSDTQHALLSASSSERWISCPGSIALCKGLPDQSSKFADEGTKAHDLAATILSGPSAQQNITMDYDAQMLEEVLKYTNLVCEFVQGGSLFVEKRVDYSNFIGVENSFGTSDAIIISENGKEIVIIDLKYGKGVRVDADNNSQMMLYALGAINEFDILGYQFERVRMVIHQPRLNHISEWTCTLGELMDFAERARNSALVAMACYNAPSIMIPQENLRPSEKACRFCKAKASCPALAESAATALGNGFDVITDEVSPETLLLVEGWLKAKRAEIESRLLSGEKLNFWKLVRGRQGARQWASKDDAEALLKSMRLKQEEMYSFELISPTTAEKLLKDNPKRWARAEELIVRKDGAISVAPVDDKRPALVLAQADAGFDDVSINEDGE